VAAALLQLGVYVYVILYQIVAEEVAKLDDPKPGGIEAAKPDVEPDRGPPEG
jgi:hypothetical protein